ncbi:unnamed protein product, partial [Anisakis simplex]|uniref:Cyclin_C domain-containing protein n=1 Tax=Anisakis simplex TaxID=6269 RepID=A0A0M3JQL9_ANISI
MKCKEDGSDETSDEYANRVAALMADKLGLISTPYTCYDAVDEAKRFLNESKQHTTNANGNTSAPQATKFRRSNKHLSNAQLDSITMRIKQ